MYLGHVHVHGMFMECTHVHRSWNLYKFKNNYIQINYTHKVES